MIQKLRKWDWDLAIPFGIFVAMLCMIFEAGIVYVVANW